MIKFWHYDFTVLWGFLPDTKIAIIDTTLSSFKSTTIPLLPLAEKYHGGKRYNLITAEQRRGILNIARNEQKIRVPLTIRKPTTQYEAMENAMGKGPEIHLLDSKIKYIPDGGITKDKNINIFVDDKEDGSGIFALQIYKNDVAIRVDTTHYDSNNLYSLDLTDFVIGDTVSIYAYDQAGNYNSKTLNTIDLAKTGYFINNNHPDFSMKLSDASSGIDSSSYIDLDGPEYKLSDTDMGTYSYNPMDSTFKWTSKGIYNYDTLNSTLVWTSGYNLSEGYHAWRLLGFDNAGNAIEDDWHTFTVDTTLPQLIALSPTGPINYETAYITGQVVDSTSGIDITYAKITFNNEAEKDLAIDSAGNFSFPLTFSSPPIAS